MGDIKKHRAKFSGPSHPWQKERIDEEKELLKEYGLRRKNEIWKMKSLLKNFFAQAKKIIAFKTEQSEKEKIQLLNRLKRLGIIDETKDVEDILGLSIRDVLERRLQSIVFRKVLSRSMTQSRQFIVHGHILIGDEKINVPSYLVLRDQEAKITFSVNSKLSDEEHPERVVKPKKPKIKVIKPIKKRGQFNKRKQFNKRR